MLYDDNFLSINYNILHYMYIYCIICVYCLNMHKICIKLHNICIQYISYFLRLIIQLSKFKTFKTYIKIKRTNARLIVIHSNSDNCTQVQEFTNIIVNYSIHLSSRKYNVTYFNQPLIELHQCVIRILNASVYALVNELLTVINC